MDKGQVENMLPLVPLYLGIKAVLAKSFARIHQANLVNNGIIPLIFKNPEDYDNVKEMDELLIENTFFQVKRGIVKIKNLTKGKEYKMLLKYHCKPEKNNSSRRTFKFGKVKYVLVEHDLDKREKEIIKAGGILPYYRSKKLD